MMLKQRGASRFGRIIGRDSDQAQRLDALIDAHPRRLEPVTLEIVSFSQDPGGMDAAARAVLTGKILMRLQETGVAAFSDTLVHGMHWLRAALCNPRITDQDLELAAAAVGEEAAGRGDQMRSGAVGLCAALWPILWLSTWYCGSSPEARRIRP